MIFVAIPYYHFDKEIIERRVSIISKYCGSLLEKNIMCTSPVLFGTTVLKYCHLPDDFGFWDKLSFSYLEKATELHILMLPGWRESKGVNAEIKFALDHNIAIKYVGIKTDESIGQIFYFPKFFEN